MKRRTNQTSGGGGNNSTGTVRKEDPNQFLRDTLTVLGELKSVLMHRQDEILAKMDETHED